MIPTVNPSRHSVSVLDVDEFGELEISASELLGGPNRSSGPQSYGEQFFSVRLRGDRAVVQVKGYVGLIPLTGDIMLNVRPRVGISSIARVLEISGYLPGALPDVLRSYATAGNLRPSLLSAYADGLFVGIADIVSRGLMKDYVREEVRSSSPRGRVLIRETMHQTSRGVHHEAVSASYNRTADIPANEALLCAVHMLSRFNARSRSAANDAEWRRVASVLNACSLSLPGVSLVQPEQLLSDPYLVGTRQLPALRSYYRAPLDLAIAILRGQGVDWQRRTGDIALQSLVLDMSDVFERYLRGILAHLSIGSTGFTVLNGNLGPPSGAKQPLLASGGPFIAKPDVVVRSGDREPLIIEVKYVPATGVPSIDAVHQSIAYGLSYGAGNVVVAQPAADGPSGLSKLGRIGAMTLWQYVFDLGASSLEQQEESFRGCIAELVGIE